MTGLSLAILGILYVVVSALMYILRMIKQKAKSSQDDKKIILIIALFTSCWMMLSLLGSFVWTILSERFIFTIVNWKIHDFSQYVPEDPSLTSKIIEVQKGIKSTDDVDDFTKDEIRF